MKIISINLPVGLTTSEKLLNLQKFECYSKPTITTNMIPLEPNKSILKELKDIDSLSIKNTQFENQQPRKYLDLFIQENLSRSFNSNDESLDKTQSYTEVGQNYNLTKNLD